ncbi:methyltransferase family protein [Nocardia arthritidis]|uniref:Isoprenylcysteine carboxylmethyltransferase family protein n=1 Tax=Nocardia arthritidis TaxID=228602 RepID=A0A6G9YEA0_9NOCA|nr:isoprenylcysteine carboxylmethyltransferase family protein [Nocardia arthritidis]QIS11559.1 isoprenylcysteine carboxylmethyltransferase family protein [Nocardia arthritidis]
MSRAYVVYTIALVGAVAICGAIVFLSAWTLNYWQAWALMAAMLGSYSAAILASFARRDEAPSWRRRSGESQRETLTSQRLIVILARLGFCALLVVPGFDHRFGWSSVPPSISLAADLLVAAGLLITYRVRQEILRRATSVTTEAPQDRRMISTGPFAVVRSPMHAGVLLYAAAIPVALGSWWGLVVFAGMVPLSLMRMSYEEKVLRQIFTDYSDYTQKVEYRLLPHIW